MPETIQAGTILIEDHPLIAQDLAIASKPYAGNWSMVEGSDGVKLDRKSRGAGWNFFFMAAEVKVMFFGVLGAKKIQKALRRIFAKVRQQPCNALEITGIVRKRFLSVPYTIVSAHSRHIQQSCYLNEENGRWTSQIAMGNRSAVEHELRFRSALS